MRLATFLLGLSCAAPAAQQPPAKPPEIPPPPVSSAPAKTPDPFAALVPGAIPAGSSAEARSSWEATCAASTVPGPRPEPVRAFELTVDVRYRGNQKGSNDLLAEFRFLAPTFVRVKLVEGQREVGRGPDGDWLDDGTRKERVLLDKGREYKEDRRQLDQWQAIAKDFVALTDPKSLRIAKLEVLPSAPASLPENLAKRGGELAWLRVASPDFRLVDVPPDPPRLFRASLGRDRKTGWVELALIEEDAPEPVLRPTATLLELLEPTPLQGFDVPKHILVHAVDAGRAIPAIASVAGMDLYLRIPGSSLRASFAPADFKLQVR
jgi:hypothetical protein